MRAASVCRCHGSNTCRIALSPNRAIAGSSAIQSEQSMWIVKVALQRPCTFLMLALLIVLMGGYAILNTATDIFPNIKIPIAAVIWRYNGILPRRSRIASCCSSERVAQTTVNDVERQAASRAVLP
jgi:hypothetical protein